MTPTFCFLWLLTRYGSPTSACGLRRAMRLLTSSVDIAGPTGSTVKETARGLAPTSTATTGDFSAFGGGDSTIGIENAAVTSIMIYVIVVNGATAGDVNLRWAQNASSATATTVQANSHLIARRVA